VTKQGENKGGITQKEFEILQGLANFLTIKQIAKHRGSCRQGIYKTLNTLLGKGFVEKRGQNYALTSKGKGGATSLVRLRKNLRLHRLSFKFLVLENPRNWDQKRSIMTTFPIFDKRIKLKNNYQDFFSMGSAKIKTTSKSIIIFLPHIYDSNVDDAVLRSMDMLYDLIPKIEAQFKVKLVKDRKANITISSQQWARVNDSLAKLYRKEKKKLYVTDEQGKVWLIADYSFNVDELETVDNIRSDEDMNIINPFMNDLRQDPCTLSELKGAIKSNTDNMAFYAENLRTHIGVIKDLNKGVNELRKEKYKPFFVRWWQYYFG